MNIGMASCRVLEILNEGERLKAVFIVPLILGIKELEHH
jgi:hypothetical protein